MIAGLGVAAQLVTDNVEEYSAHMKEVRDYLESQLEVSLMFQLSCSYEWWRTRVCMH